MALIAASTQSTPQPVKVLLVDDDPALLEELHDVIELEGWTPITALTVEGAMELLKSDRSIRVVVTDVHFRNGADCANGIQFVSRARAKFADRTITYVVLSGDHDQIFSSKDEGAFKFLPKPPVPQRLVDTILRAITMGDGEVAKNKPVSILGSNP